MKPLKKFYLYFKLSFCGSSHRLHPPHLSDGSIRLIKNKSGKKVEFCVVVPDGALIGYIILDPASAARGPWTRGKKPLSDWYLSGCSICRLEEQEQQQSVCLIRWPSIIQPRGRRGDCIVASWRRLPPPFVPSPP